MLFKMNVTRNAYMDRDGNWYEDMEYLRDNNGDVILFEVGDDQDEREVLWDLALEYGERSIEEGNCFDGTWMFQGDYGDIVAIFEPIEED